LLRNKVYYAKLYASFCGTVTAIMENDEIGQGFGGG